MDRNVIADTMPQPSRSKTAAHGDNKKTSVLSVIPIFFLLVTTLFLVPIQTLAFSSSARTPWSARSHVVVSTQLSSTSKEDENPSKTLPTPTPRPSESMEIDHKEPDDAIIHIAPKAMIRLRELRAQKNASQPLILRMGVRNGGCSGLSYVMDFSTEDEIQDGDAIDEYDEEGLRCVVDAKSMLYLYGLELDYSDDLIGGGFKFFNPNAEESCGCGSSFGI